VLPGSGNDIVTIVVDRSIEVIIGYLDLDLGREHNSSSRITSNYAFMTVFYSVLVSYTNSGIGSSSRIEGKSCERIKIRCINWAITGQGVFLGSWAVVST
jgi:hypothetical protein